MKKWEELEKDADFVMLAEKYKTPSLDVIMDGHRSEERHSAFVRWLLEDAFALEQFLRLLESKMGKLSINRKDLLNTEFKTEYTVDGGRVDIFGENASSVFVIENKIRADETRRGGRPQSMVYFEHCEKNFKNKRRVYVLLKAFSETEVECPDFIPVTYQDLYDFVLKPTWEHCKKSELGDTARILEDYALSISSPFAEVRLAYTEKEAASRIYKKYGGAFEEIRNDIKENGPDSGSDLCNFFKKYEKIINYVILESLGKSIIEKFPKRISVGKKEIKKLIDAGIIILGQTRFVYSFAGARCIISIDKNFIFHAEYKKYDVEQVVVLPYEFLTLHRAALELEDALGSSAENGGKPAPDWKLLCAGKPEANGKSIREALNM